MTLDMHEWEENWDSKCWGSVCHVFDSPEIAVSLLKVKAGFRCSRHMHTRRRNQFIVISGKIDVWEWGDWNDLVQSPDRPIYRHKNMDNITIASHRPHMFIVRESGLVVEIYTPDGGPVSLTDIIRFDEGGAFCD